MPTALTNGVQLYYERHGEAGEPLVFVHGYTGDISDWRYQIPEFLRTHRVLVLDNRGHGRSEAPGDRAAYTVEAMAHDVEALVEEVGFDRYHLVGHSMGGAVAQETALRAPGRLLSLTLHDTSHRFGGGARAELMQRWLEYRHRVAEEQGMAAVAELPSPVAPPPHMPAERQQETKRRLAAMSVDAFLGAWAGLDAWAGTTDRVAEIRLPTLVVYGDLDAAPLVAASQFLAATIPGAVIEMIPETGHSPQFERPEFFNVALRRHLERNSAGAAK